MFVLARYFPPPYKGKLPICIWTMHADLNLPSGDDLLVYDEEARQRGINRWSTASPWLWIGHRDALVEMMDGIDVIEISQARAWVILYDAEWAGGWHYAREMGRIRTPGGNSLWYLDDLQAAFARDCDADSLEGWPDKWGP